MGGRDYVHDDAEGYRQHAEGAKAFLNLGLAIKEKGCPEVIYESQPQMCYDQNAIAGTITEKGKFDEYYNRVKAQIEPAGMQMEIPQMLFKGMVEKEIFHDTGHLAAKGHDLYADYLIGQLAARSASFRKYAGVPEPTEPREPNLPEPTP